MKRVCFVITALFLAALTGCGNQSSNSSVTSDDNAYNTGLEKGSLKVNLALGGCEEKLSPKIKVLADYFVDVTDHGEMVAKEVAVLDAWAQTTVKYKKPSAIGDSISIESLQSSIVREGKSYFGSAVLRVESLIFVIEGLNDRGMSPYIKVRLPLKYDKNGYYDIADDEYKKIQSSLKFASNCYRASFSYQFKNY